MKALSLIVASLVSWAGIASAQTITITTTVMGTTGPWQWVNGGLNTADQYGVGDGTAPTVISAADGFRFSVGDSLTISYLSGLISGITGGPLLNALGDTTNPVNNTPNDGHGDYFPSLYMTPYPIYCNELVGAFANSSGQIVSTPFAIGNLGTFTVPSGATQLQLGNNDTNFGDNSGSWNIQITGIPEPTTTALVLMSLVGFGLTTRRCRKSVVR